MAVVVLRALVLTLALVSPTWAYYLTLEPPVGWSPPSAEWDGEAMLKVWPAGKGPAGADGATIVMENRDTRDVTASIEPYANPVANWLWRLSPGAEAHAFVPAAVYAGMLANAGIRVGAQRYAVPVFLRSADAAGRLIARQIARSKNAEVVAIATTLVGLMGLNWTFNSELQMWEKAAENAVEGTGLEYRVVPAGASYYASMELACNAYSIPGRPIRYIFKYDGVWRCGLYSETETPGNIFHGVVNPFLSRAGGCDVGRFVGPTGECLDDVQRVAIDPVEWEEIMMPELIPPYLPELLPHGVPVQAPSINPGPSPWDDEQPFFIPTSDPVPNPNFDPNADPSVENPPELQPGINVRPAPTTSNPWQVDAQPANKPITGPEDVVKPGVLPKPDPTKDPGTGSGTTVTVKPSDKPPLICEVFPNMSACQPLGTAPSPEPLANKDVAVSVSPSGGFGPSGGTCPDPITLTVFGEEFYLSWEPMCDLAGRVRPLVIALGWLSVAGAMFGIGGRS